MRPVRLLAPALLIVVVAACASATTSTPSPSASPSAMPSAAPSTAASPSIVASDPTATAEAVATPEATSAPSLSPEETELIGRLRADSAADCTPRRTELPAGALYGIECDPGDSLVQRVGVYRYASPNDAAFAYLTRMADAGIDVNEGDCIANTPGDGAYYPGDGEGTVGDPDVFTWDNKALVTERNGCFLDEFGNANVRLVCDTDYIGILGARDNLSTLLDWAWTYPDGYEPGTPDLPGLCIGPATVAATP